MRHASSAILCALLLGCATTDVDSDIDIATSSDRGLVVGSIFHRHEGGRVVTKSSFYFRVRADGSGQQRVVEYGTGEPLLNPFSDTDFEEGEGRVFALELPAGDYEFFAWKAGSSHVRIYSPAVPALPFQISPGKATYIGSFRMNIAAAKTLIGIPTLDNADVRVEDQHDRDLRVLADKYPKLRTSDVQLTPLDASSWAGVRGTRSTTPIVVPQ